MGWPHPHLIKMSVTLDEIVQNAKVSLEYLNKTISDAHVLDFAKYFTKYEEIGPHLGLAETTLEEIGRDYHTTELKRRATLRKFRDEYLAKATYHRLIEALIACKMAHSAFKICKELYKEEGKEGHAIACQ